MLTLIGLDDYGTLLKRGREFNEKNYYVFYLYHYIYTIMCNNLSFPFAKQLAISVKSGDRTNSNDPNAYINEKENKSSIRHRTPFYHDIPRQSFFNINHVKHNLCLYDPHFYNRIHKISP